MSLALALLALLGTEPESIPTTMPRGVATMALLLDVDATPDERLHLLSIGWHESRWRTDAIDAVRGAVGPTQIEHPHLWGSSRAAVLSDPAEGYRVALRVLRASRAACPGTWARVLTVFVSGKCGVAPRKARELCAPIGLCDAKLQTE
jgi:hypothetical protein